MRRSQSSSEHAEAVSRRLATLSAELAAVRGEPDDVADPAHGHTRVRERPDPFPAPVSAPGPAPVVPSVPGRHASRRLRVGGLQLGPVHLAVVAVVAALAVGLAAWWAVRDQAEMVPATAVSSAATPLAPVPTDTPVDEVVAGGGTGGDGELVVDVAGKVRRPGIAVLPAGSRVV